MTPAITEGITAQLLEAFDAQILGVEPAQQAVATDLGAYPVLYVSSDLHTLPLTQDEARWIAEDLTQVDADGRRRAYRRLSGHWLCWLESRMRRAWQAYLAEEMPQERWERLLGRYLPVKAWAQGRWGAADVQRSTQHQPHPSYLPPTPIPAR